MPETNPNQPPDGTYQSVITDIRPASIEGRPATRVGTVLELPHGEARRVVWLIARPIGERASELIGRRLAVRVVDGQPQSIAALSLTR